MDTCELLLRAAPLDLAALADKVDLCQFSRLAAAADVAAWHPPAQRARPAAAPKRALPRNRRLRAPPARIPVLRTPLRPSNDFANRRASSLPAPSPRFSASPLARTDVPRRTLFNEGALPRRRHSARPLQFSRASRTFSLPAARPQFSADVEPSSSDDPMPLYAKRAASLPVARASTFCGVLPSGGMRPLPPARHLPPRKRLSFPPPRALIVDQPDAPSALVVDLAAGFATPSPKKRRVPVLGSPNDIRTTALHF